MPITFDLTTSQGGQTAVDFLAEHTALPKARIKDAMNKGACWWVLKGKQQRLRRATKMLDQGSRIQFYYDENVLNRTVAEPQLVEDFGRYSAWNKPHGMLAQGSQWGDHCSLLRYVEVHTKRPVYLIHRLDADAAGIMLIAHDAQAAAKLSALFQGRELHKEYRAWVEGQINITEELIIDTPLESKDARSRVTLLKYDAEKNKSFLKVVIETGRKHQIRRHLASIGHPIINDRIYGKAGKEYLQLVAHKLAFNDPLSMQPVQIIIDNVD